MREHWEGKTRRSFTYVDGLKRVRDLATQIEPIQTPDDERHMIYPAKDERVLRIVRKIVRGLYRHHNLLLPVLDGQVLADIQRFQVPDECLSETTTAHAEEDVLEYRYGVVDEPERRVAHCLDPFDPASRSIVQKALRSIKPTEARNERDRNVRGALRQRILGEALEGDAIPQTGTFPGMGEKWGQPRDEQVAISVRRRFIGLPPSDCLAVLIRKIVTAWSEASERTPLNRQGARAGLVGPGSVCDKGHYHIFRKSTFQHERSNALRSASAH